MTKFELEKLIRQVGLRPSRGAGQHFLMDETVVERMAEAASVGPHDVVLEIGPGFGVLTKLLLARGAKVISVELEQRLIPYLQKIFGQEKNFTLVEGDVFKVRLDQYLTDHKFKLVANLPYSATSLVFRQFLSHAPRPTEMCVLIQKEVAERITAAPGDMSMLALSVQYFGQPTKLFEIPPSSFFPAPAVTSSVLQVKKIKEMSAEDEKMMFRLARMAFSGRRKQLRNTLAGGLHVEDEKIADWLMELGIPPESRPQDLTVDNWLILAKNCKF